MIGIVLHKTRDSNTELPKYGDKCIAHKNLLTKQESILLEHSTICVCNANTKIKNNASKYILDLYKKYKIEALHFLKQEFSFAIFDKNNNTFFGARDRMGIKPFYYYNSKDKFIYSTDIKFIIENIDTHELDEKWILNSLSSTVFDKTTSPIKEIKKLPPAHYLILNEKDELIIENYWSLKKQKLPTLSEKEHLLNLKIRFEDAIKNRLMDKVGGELSGGIDSSGIIGFIAKTQKEVYTYTHLLANEYHHKIAPYTDERYYRNLLVSKYKNINIRNVDVANKGLFSELQKELKIHGVPLNNALTYFSDGIFDKAKSDGVDVLFSGFGGDEGISNYASLLPYEYAKHFKLILLKEALGVSYFSKEYIHKLLKPNLSFLKKKDKSWQQKSYDILFINTKFAERNHFKKIFWEHHQAQKSSNLDKHIYQKLTVNYISNRAELTGTSARARGFEYTFPLLDTDLIEYYYSMPNNLKYRQGIGRYAYREIIKNLVPFEIYQRKDKTGATVPSVLHRFMKDYKIIEEFLQSTKKGKASLYIDFDKMLKGMLLIKQILEGKKIRANPHIFFNALMLVLYLENEY